MTPKVFVSYRGQDAALASKITNELEKSGLQLWDVTKRLTSADNFRQVIRAAIDQSQALVVIVGSPSAANGGWLSYEAGMFDAMDKPVFVLASNVHAQSDFPADLRDTRFRTFDPAEPEVVARSVASDLMAVR
jgi:TIR domain